MIKKHKYGKNSIEKYRLRNSNKPKNPNIQVPQEEIEN